MFQYGISFLNEMFPDFSPTPTTFLVLILILLTTTILYITTTTTNSKPSPPSTKPPQNITPLQAHILFWDRDADSIIHPSDIYTGFRDLGFSIPFSILALLIPVFFSYPTRLAHSYFPDPWFRIYVDAIHKAKHGSDTGVYDLKGGFREDFFEGLFAEFDGRRGKMMNIPTTETERGIENAHGNRDSESSHDALEFKEKEIHGERVTEENSEPSLGINDLWRMISRNRVAADPAGWSFAMMEWGTTWLLLQREGRVWKDDLRACYDGSLFWRLREERERGVVGMNRKVGYGFREFGGDVLECVGRWWRGERFSLEEIVERKRN